MVKTQKQFTASYLRDFARYGLLVIGLLVFIFALLSGSESYGGGITGIIKNSPNALPWLILLVFLLIAWKWQLIGGIMITLLGFSLFIFFNTLDSGVHWAPFIVSIIPVIFGVMFILSWWMGRD